MAYRDNVSALAAQLGVSNDPGLREEDLEIEGLVFTDQRHVSFAVIDGTPMNRGGRLFFQFHSKHPQTGDRRTALPLSELREEAQKYFAELWEPNPEPGKRALLDAIRDSKHAIVNIVWKDFVPARTGPSEENGTL